MGQTLTDLQKIEGVVVSEWGGWGHVAHLPSGWKAAIFVGEYGADRRLRYDDEVDLLFLGTAAGYGARLPEYE